jgi:hypothetical protein
MLLICGKKGLSDDERNLSPDVRMSALRKADATTERYSTGRLHAMQESELGTRRPAAVEQ